MFLRLPRAHNLSQRNYLGWTAWREEFLRGGDDFWNDLEIRQAGRLGTLIETKSQYLRLLEETLLTALNINSWAIAHVEEILRDNINEPVTVAELSRMTGVSERTLRSAFHDLVGVSPKQYALKQRLHAAREALAAAGPGTTVTDVAMTYGFFELGRFAGRYRMAFGEMPSQTLHHRRPGATGCIEAA